MKTRIVIIAAILLQAGVSHGQNDSLLQRIAFPQTNPDWIKFRPGVVLDPQAFFQDYKTGLGLGSADDMRLIKTESDDLGFTHYRFQQYYKNYRVNGGEYILHLKSQTLHSGNGKLAKGLTQIPDIKIAKQKAMRLAMNFLPSSKYAWEIPELENDKKKREHNNTATFYPLGELVWVYGGKEDRSINSSDYRLAFMFDIYTAGLDGKRIFVDASNGSIIIHYPLVPVCDGTSAGSNFNGTVNFSTRLVSNNPGLYHLFNDCQTAYVNTHRMTDTIIANSVPYASSDNTWNTVPSAVTSHWGIERAYAYFLNVHNRQSWNNANAGIDIYQDALFRNGPGTPKTNPSNASFGSGIMQVGNSGTTDPIDDWNSLDIVGHEFAHGVTETSAGLEYLKESGALNESFSDIFGVNCYAWFNGLTANKWRVGFDRKVPGTTNSLFIRDMSNPNNTNPNSGSNPCPDTYYGTNWINTTAATDPGDLWGVHTNSGVQNYMYYLLVTGGSGTNDAGTPFSVLGIGITNARQIAYRALTVYLTSTSNHYDARNAWVHAAADIFGECHFFAIQTGKAWYAVGIDPPINNPGNNQFACGDHGNTPAVLQANGTYYLSSNCDMTILPTNNAVGFGGYRVTISPAPGYRFKATNGSRFRAFINDCRFSAY